MGREAERETEHGNSLSQVGKNESAGKSEFKHKTVGASKLAPLACSCVKEDQAFETFPSLSCPKSVRKP